MLCSGPCMTPSLEAMLSTVNTAATTVTPQSSHSFSAGPAHPHSCRAISWKAERSSQCSPPLRRTTPSVRSPGSQESDAGAGVELILQGWTGASDARAA
ncbi:hypothetical protein HaLaN_10477 [Haematococcus lacustris]|uniref:Uncharacterized protein n=1 Tax=Haematococcus lacustris TaxID=44745 RepID=A0A699Z570_HAELA|nr:hypothetical protein HaLaN_10477 [Haematococcus lacustris]